MSYYAFKKHEIILAALGIRSARGVKRRWIGTLMDFYLSIQIFNLVLWSGLYFRGAIVYLPDSFMDRIVGLTAAISATGSLAKMITIRRKEGILKQLFEQLGHYEVTTSRGKLVSRVTSIFEMSVAAIAITHNHHILTDSTLHRSSPFWTASADDGTPAEIYRDFFFTLNGVFVLLTANVIGDTLFLTLINQICHRLLILFNTLSSIGKGFRTQDCMEIPDDATDAQVIKMCVDEHILLLKMTKQLEELYNTILLAQLTFSFIDTCLTLFTISQYEDFMEAMNQVFPQFFALFLELFLFCWGGQMINDHFAMLHLGAYDSEWYSLSKEDRKSMYVIQAFTRKPVNLVCASIFQLNFPFYEAVCKEVFSYYTIMRQLFSQ